MNTPVSAGFSSYPTVGGKTYRLYAVLRGEASVADAQDALSRAGLSVAGVWTHANDVPNDWPSEDAPPVSGDERVVRAQGVWMRAGDLPTAIPIGDSNLVIFFVWEYAPSANADAGRVVDVMTEFPEIFSGEQFASAAPMADKLDDAFYPALKSWSQMNNVDAGWALLVFYLETRLNPTLCNSFGYCGLNQLSSAELRRRGVEPSAYQTWPASQQMTEIIGPWYADTIKRYLKHKPPRSPGVLYALNIAPGNVALRGDGPGAVMYSSPSREYNANKGLDVDKSGEITISDFDVFMYRLAQQAPFKNALAKLGQSQIDDPLPPEPEKATSAATVALTAGAVVAAAAGATAIGWYLLSKHKRALRAAEDASQIQTLIFPRDEYTIAQAKSWARSHGFRAAKVDIKTNTIRVRQANPRRFSRMRTITMGDNVKAVVGWR